MKAKILALFFIAIFNTIVFSQKDDLKLAIHLLANDKIAEVNIDQDIFLPTMAKITDYCKSSFSSLPTTQKIGILVIAHKSGAPTYKIYSNPTIDKALEDKTLKDLSDIQLENTKLVDFPFFIAINCTSEGEITDFEDYIDPIKQKLTDYLNADLQTKLKLNIAFAIEEVLPVLNAYQVMVDDKFVGVKNFGKLVQKTNFSEKQNIENLTTANQYYWRAMMEMEVGNQIIPVTKIFALVSQGEFDYAQRHIEIINIYSNPKTIANRYLEEIQYRLDAFSSELNEKIKKGIAEHDNGAYQKAIDIYDDVLKIYPNSAWALYEKYFSENSKNVVEQKITLDDRADWDAAKVEIYKHNPMYGMDVRASTGKEAYILFRRQEVNSLFQDKENRVKDTYKYGEIATDLGVYDFAASLFWITATFDKDNSQKSIDYFLYCLDKLGEKELKSNFKKNFTKTFKKIDEERLNSMKNSDIYKSMKKKN